MFTMYSFIIYKSLTMKEIKYLFWSIFAIICAFGLFGGPANALAVAVSPVVIEHDLAPGMSASGKIRVTNTMDEDAVYYIGAQRFLPVGEEGRQEYIVNEEDVMSFYKWFSFNENKLIIPPKSTVEVEYTINAPLDAEPGGHYGAVFLSLDPPDLEPETTGSKIAPKTGVLFLVKVAGDITEQANIESFTVNKKVLSHLPAFFDLRIRNTGNIHFRPKGTLEIRNMWGGVVARVPANPRNSAVLPSSIRRINTWWAKSETMASGGRFIDGLANEWHNFALGRYTAKVDVKYGSSNTAFPAQEVSFWVIPWRMGLILFIALVILFFVMKAYNKAIVSKAIKNSSKKK